MNWFLIALISPILYAAYKLIVPKMVYRNDIGLKFLKRDGAMLREWGYA